jgi:hypothetical protein
MLRSIAFRLSTVIWIGMILAPFPARYATAQAGDTGFNMAKHDLAGNGLIVFLPNEPGFAEELNKLQLDNKPGMDAAQPFSVIVKNASRKAVAAFAIRWKIKDPNGFVRTQNVMQLEARALLDGGRRRTDQLPIAAGTSRLVTVEGIIMNPEALRNFSSSFQAPEFTVVGVELDLAVLDDGEAIGPDQAGLLPIFKAAVDAKQDLMEEISGRLSQGGSLHEILVSLNNANKRAPRTYDPMDPVATYAATRQQYLDELTTTEQNFGEEIALRSLKYHKYDNRSNIHRRDGQ